MGPSAQVPLGRHPGSLSLPQFASGALASQLALLLLERSDSLFQVEGYEADVHRWVSPGSSMGLHPSCALSPGHCRPPPQPHPQHSPLGTSWAAAQTLPTPESCHIPSPPASLGQNFPEDALSESPTCVGLSPRQPGPRTEPAPPAGSSRQAVGLGSLERCPLRQGAELPVPGPVQAASPVGG